ncbi:MAG: hypothetical protein WCJ56_08285, partial [bacterium]
MPLYECRRNAENHIEVKPEWRDAVVFGTEDSLASIVATLQAQISDRGRAVTVAFDGWYNINWAALIPALTDRCAAAGITLTTMSINGVFKPRAEIDVYKQANITDDPGFGMVNTDGTVQDLLDMAKVSALATTLEIVRQGDGCKAMLVYGPGAAIAELNGKYDLKYYFDKTRQPILWEMWDGKLTPFGQDTPRADYGWKEYYYCDYYLLDRQKEYALEQMDYWVEGIAFDKLKIVPRAAYDGILQTLVQYPVKEVTIFQPGPWGAYRYKDIFEVPGLECNAWNELAGPELSMLVDIEREDMLNMPTMNLLQYADQFVGPYLNETYPHLFPLDVWLDDGYFPKPTPAERISMPIHTHPSTDYVKKHFKEPLGRYETYYIAEAYEGANTWMGFHENADLEEWERLCRESENLTEIPNWKEFIANWESNVGDLYLIPPGTVHGHGGNQMVLEMDTCPSVAATEYSFFEYDFARPSWDDTSKTMTAKPLKMHTEHSFDNEKWVRASWVKDNLRAKPKVVKWTKEYLHDRYSSDPRMPFEVERFHFDNRAEYDTQGKFIHIVTLTIGEQVIIRSKSNPDYQADILLFQSALIPACFG